MEYEPSFSDDLYLIHYGVKGMKWGVRRYQNPDGTLTKAGRVHQAKLAAKTGENYRGPNTDKYRQANRSADRGDILVAKGKTIDKLTKKRAKATGNAFLDTVGYGMNVLKGPSEVARLSYGGTKIASINTADILRTKMYVDFALRSHYNTQIKDIEMADKRRNAKNDNRWAN